MLVLKVLDGGASVEEGRDEDIELELENRLLVVEGVIETEREDDIEVDVELELYCEDDE